LQSINSHSEGYETQNSQNFEENIRVDSNHNGIIQKSKSSDKFLYLVHFYCSDLKQHFVSFDDSSNTNMGNFNRQDDSPTKESFISGSNNLLWIYFQGRVF